MLACILHVITYIVQAFCFLSVVTSRLLTVAILLQIAMQDLSWPTFSTAGDGEVVRGVGVGGNVTLYIQFIKSVSVCAKFHPRQLSHVCRTRVEGELEEENDFFSFLKILLYNIGHFSAVYIFWTWH